MSLPRRAHTLDKPLTLFAGTWNVNGRSPDADTDMTAWLFPSPRVTPARPADIYMLGLQEVQALSGVDAVRTDQGRGTAWRNTIQATLSSDYQLIAQRQLVGIMVFVFARINHIPFISDVQLAYAATGFLNAMGNKGGVAARFLLYNRSVACVACHLAAHTANVERRNQDFADVVRKAVFAPPSSSTTGPTSSALPGSTADSTLTTSASTSLPSNNAFPQPSISRHAKSAFDTSSVSNSSLPAGLPAAAVGTTSWLGSVASVAATAFYDLSTGANSTILNDPESINVLNHDVIFWLGDLNYRIEAPLDETLQAIEEKDWRGLIQNDQLQLQMKSYHAFKGFKEGPITFAPTYKYNRFSNDYAKDENGAVKRVPAYTDRILWRVGVEDDDPNGYPDLRLVEYSSAPDVYSSDHRPVYAVFSMTFGVEDFSRKRPAESNDSAYSNNSSSSKFNISKNASYSVNSKSYQDRDGESRSSLSPPSSPQYNSSIQLSKPFLDFGDVYFGKQSEASVSARNHGSSSITLSVLRSANLPGWLQFDFGRWQNIELRPSQSMSLPVLVHVTNKDAIVTDLINNGCNLETKLTLVSNPGKVEQSIRIHGRYIVTTLGIPLERLSLLSEPVILLRRSDSRPRSSDSQPSRRSKQSGVISELDLTDSPSSIPKEIWLLVDRLVKEDEDGNMPMSMFPHIFQTRGDHAQEQRALAFVDRAERIPHDVDADAIADCLLSILDNLNDSVIPTALYKQTVEAGLCDDPEAIRSVTDLLPPLNWSVFWYLIGFVCQVPAVQHREEDIRGVARVFAQVLIRSPSDSKQTLKEDKAKTAFIVSAIRMQQRNSSNFATVIDLSNPETHPRRLNGTR